MAFQKIFLLSNYFFIRRQDMIWTPWPAHILYFAFSPFYPSLGKDQEWKQVACISCIQNPLKFYVLEGYLEIIWEEEGVFTVVQSVGVNFFKPFWCLILRLWMKLEMADIWTLLEPNIHKLKEVHIHVDKHGHIISDLLKCWNFLAALGKKLFYQRISCAICSATSRRSGYIITARCHPKGGSSE